MYATLADMVERYGEAEILRMSVIDGDLPEDLEDPRVEARVSRAIETASSVIDSFLGKRYTTPIAVPPLSVVEAACVIARHWLSSSGSTTPSETAQTARDQTLSWLNKIAQGMVTIEGLAAISKSSSARVSDRPAIYDPGTGGRW
jgi:phage gp36-like protein